MEQRNHRAFETTEWSLIDALRRNDPGAADRALSELVQMYWPAVYSYLRRVGMDPEQAGETTQAFFTDVVLTRQLFQTANRESGRLRSLILTALKRYQIDLARRGKAHPDWDGPDPSVIGPIEARTKNETTPEQAFEREWAIAMLDEARRRCEEHFRTNGKPGHWTLFEARYISPATSGSASRPLQALAAEHGFQTPAAAAAAMQVVRKRFRSFLIGVLSEQCPHDTENELAEALQSITGR